MSSLPFASIESWDYRDIAAPLTPSLPERPAAELPTPPQVVGFTEEQVLARVHEALREAEQRWAEAADDKEGQRRTELLRALEAFATERSRYFQQVEGHVVQLALAIAKKILGREAELDPTLLSALVRIALDRMGAGPAVRLRLPPEEIAQWQQQLAGAVSAYEFDFVAEESLKPGECVVETDLGTASFGFDAQLKEVEQNLFDLIARRPAGA